MGQAPAVEEKVVEEKMISGNIIMQERPKEVVVEQRGLKGVLTGVDYPRRQAPPPVARQPSTLEVVAVNSNTHDYHRQQQQLSNNNAQMLARQQSLNYEQQQLLQLQQQQELEDLNSPPFEVTEELVGVDPDLTNAHRQGKGYKVTLNLTSLIAKTTRASSVLSRPKSARMVYSPFVHHPSSPPFYPSPSITSPTRQFTDGRSNTYTPSVFESATITPHYSPLPHSQFSPAYNASTNQSIVVPLESNSHSLNLSRSQTSNVGFDLSLNGVTQTQQHTNAQTNTRTNTRTNTHTQSRNVTRMIEEEEETDIPLQRTYGTVPKGVYEDEEEEVRGAYHSRVRGGVEGGFW